MDEVQVGPHRMVMADGGIVELLFGRTPEEWEMKEIVGRMTEARGTRTILLLIDFTRVQTLPPEVRRVIGEGSRHLDIRAIAMYGASFHLRVVAKLVNSAIALFKKITVPQEFFADRPSAVAWLEKQAGGNA